MALSQREDFMPLYRVTFMNHIVENYIVEAEDEDAAWETEPEAVEEFEPERWDCTSCEVVDVAPAPAGAALSTWRRP